MPKTNYRSIDDYHEAFSGEILERMQIIRDLVLEVAPKVEEVISYQIPAFKLGEKFHLIYYCAFSRHLTISSVWSEAFLEEFKADLKEMKVSKSAIQLPHNIPLPLNLIKRILIFRKMEIEAQH